MANAKRDDNYVPALLAESNAGTGATVVLWADPTTHRLLVDVSGGAGTSATDDSAFTAATGSGTPIMGFVTSDSVDAGDVGVLAMLANRQLKVSIYDSAGAEVTSFGAGTEYTEDAAAAANPVGRAMIVVRDDGRAGSLVSLDGDNVALRGSNAGELYTVDANTGAIKTAVEIMDDWDETDRAKVNIIVGQAGITAGAGAVGANTPRTTLASDDPAVTALQLIDDTVYASDAAISKVLGIGAQFDDTAPGTTTENSVRALRMSTRRELYIQLRDAAGNERGANVNASNELLVALSSVPSHAVTNAGTFAVQVDGAALTALQKIDDPVLVDDAAFTPATSSVMMMGAEFDDTAPDSVDEGDAGAVRMSANRNLYVRIRDNAGNERGLNIGASGDASVTVVSALPAGTNAIGKLAANSGVDIGDVDVVSVIPGTGATNLGKAEDAAHSSGDTGVYLLGVRDDAPAAHSGTDGDYESLHVSAEGGLWTKPMPSDYEVANNSKLVKKYYTSAGAVTDGIIWSPAAGTRWHVVNLIINISAAATITLEDDLAAGDSAVMKFELAANSGVVVPFGAHPLASGEDAADLLITTTAGNVYVTVTGYEI